MIHRAATVALLLMLSGLQWRLWVAEGGVAHTHRLQGQAEFQKLENERLTVRNAVLDAEVRDLGSGIAATEARARQSLGMIRSNETFFLTAQP